jgi:hypothetical protein
MHGEKMSSISFEYLQNQPLPESKVIGESVINGFLYHVCASKGKSNLSDKGTFLNIYLHRDGEAAPGSEGFKETTYLKIWTTWEKRAAVDAESREGICSLRENGLVENSHAAPNVFHVDAAVFSEKKEDRKELCLAVKRIAYELFTSSPSALGEMHFSLTKDDDTGVARDADDFEIKRDPWEERSVGWGRSFKIDKVLERPSILK